jgi:hypothetical protein
MVNVLIYCICTSFGPCLGRIHSRGMQRPGYLIHFLKKCTRKDLWTHVWTNWSSRPGKNKAKQKVLGFCINTPRETIIHFYMHDSKHSKQYIEKVCTFPWFLYIATSFLKEQFTTHITTNLVRNKRTKIYNPSLLCRLRLRCSVLDEKDY